MKRFVAFLVMGLLAVGSAVAQSPDEQYIAIYDLVQEADALADSGAVKDALPKYTEALTRLQSFQKGYPLWNGDIVKFRLDYLARKTAELTAKLPAPVPSSGAEAQAAPVKPAPADWEQQLESTKAQVNQLQSDKALLEAKLKEALAAQPAAVDPRELAKSEEKVRALQKENELLNAMLKQEQNKAASNSRKGSQSEETINALNAQLSDLKEQLVRLNLEKEALQNRVKNLPAADAGDTNELARLRARVAVLEAPAVPFSSEELALLNKTAAPAGKVSPPQRPPAKLSKAAAAQMADAQKFVAAGKLDKAEECLLRVLKENDQDVALLGNLAEIEIQLNRLDAAEQHVLKAVALAPADPQVLSTLGNLRTRQGKFDEAVDALSRAAQLDPQNADTQNRLGVALSEKGLRAPAESALRKAILLQPSFPDAHKNLAVIYLSQNPPLTELARWHYQKALAAGAPPSPGLEKMLEAKKAGDSK